MYYYVIYSSITHASRVKRMFVGYGGHISLLHAPKEIPVNGCAYAIKVKRDMLEKILEKSRQHGINIKGVFQETADGGYNDIS